MAQVALRNFSDLPVAVELGEGNVHGISSMVLRRISKRSGPMIPPTVVSVGYASHPVGPVWGALRRSSKARPEAPAEKQPVVPGAPTFVPKLRAFAPH